MGAWTGQYGIYAVGSTPCSCSEHQAFFGKRLSMKVTLQQVFQACYLKSDKLISSETLMYTVHKTLTLS